MVPKPRLADKRALADFVESTLGTSGVSLPPRRIVAAFAGDEQADSILGWTAAIAKIGDAAVTLVRAYGHMPGAVMVPDVVALPVLSPAMMEREHQDAMFETELAREQLARHGFQPKTRVIEGSAIDVVAREARGAVADLVVLGGVKRRAIARLAEPSVATAITTMSNVSVLLARGPFRAGHILIAVDGSVESAVAIRTGFMLAQAWGAQVTVVHVDVANISWPLSAEPHRVELNAVSTAYVVVGGVPAERVPEYASEHGVDLIVTGGRSGRHFGPFYKPSTSRKISKRTNVSVLVVKTKPRSSSGLFEKDD